MSVITDVQPVAEKIIESIGLDFVDLEFAKAGRRSILRVFVGKRGGVSVEDCARISRELGAVIEAENLVPESYVLEVSSPGLDRPLKNPKDFHRNIGQKLDLQLKEEKNGKTALKGNLVEVFENGIHLNSGKTEWKISFEEISRAKVDIGF